MDFIQCYVVPVFGPLLPYGLYQRRQCFVYVIANATEPRRAPGGVLTLAPRVQMRPHRELRSPGLLRWGAHPLYVPGTYAPIAGADSAVYSIPTLTTHHGPPQACENGFYSVSGFPPFTDRCIRCPPQKGCPAEYQYVCRNYVQLTYSACAAKPASPGCVLAS
jgi:hypothetical protein